MWTARVRSPGSEACPRPARRPLYLVHGTLHLLGHDDHDDADRERMRDAESAVLERLGYARDTLPHDLD